jgi:hypothetical protein
VTRCTPPLSPTWSCSTRSLRLNQMLRTKADGKGTICLTWATFKATGAYDSLTIKACLRTQTRTLTLFDAFDSANLDSLEVGLFEVRVPQEAYNSRLSLLNAWLRQIQVIEVEGQIQTARNLSIPVKPGIVSRACSMSLMHRVQTPSIKGRRLQTGCLVLATRALTWQSGFLYFSEIPVWRKLLGSLLFAS